MNDSARAAAPPSANGQSTPDPWTTYGVRVLRARLEAGLSPADVAMREVCSTGELDRVEKGSGGKVCRALAEYLDRRLGTQGVLVDAWARALLSDRLAAGAPVSRLLLDAEHIGDFSPLAVPEFFQTPAYAAALAPPRGAGSPHAPLRGEGLWFTGRSRPALSLITTDAALRRVVGSAQTARDQLRALHHVVTAHPHIRLHVLTEGRAHPGWRGAFRTLAFSTHHTIAHQPHAVGPGEIIADAHRIGSYTALFALLHGEALGTESSLALLEDAIGALTPRAAITAAPEPRRDTPTRLQAAPTHAADPLATGAVK